MAVTTGWEITLFWGNSNAMSQRILLKIYSQIHEEILLTRSLTWNVTSSTPMYKLWWLINLPWEVLDTAWGEAGGAPLQLPWQCFLQVASGGGGGNNMCQMQRTLAQSYMIKLFFGLHFGCSVPKGILWKIIWEKAKNNPAPPANPNKWRKEDHQANRSLEAGTPVSNL